MPVLPAMKLILIKCSFFFGFASVYFLIFRLCVIDDLVLCQGYFHYSSLCGLATDWIHVSIYLFPFIYRVSFFKI